MQQPRVDQNSGSALDCTRTACELKCHSAWVTVLSFEVTLRRNEETQNCPPDLT